MVDSDLLSLKRIEAWWSQYKRSRSEWWINKFKVGTLLYTQKVHSFDVFLTINKFYGISSSFVFYNGNFQNLEHLILEMSITCELLSLYFGFPFT